MFGSISLLLCTSALFAQVPATKGKAPTASPGYLRDPFVKESLATFGPGFLGHDIKAVVALLEKASPKSKSEFETTAQFEARVASISPVGKQYVFVNDPSADAQHIDKYNDAGEFVYNADEQAFDRSIMMAYLGPSSDRRTGTGGMFMLRNITVPTGQYAATNSFGVRTIVSRIEKTLYELQVLKTEGKLSKTGGDSSRPYASASSMFIDIHAPMKTGEAISAKSHLRLAFICTVSASEVWREDNVTEPTIDNPVEIRWHEITLPVDINEIIVFDNRTGEILMTTRN